MLNRIYRFVLWLLRLPAPERLTGTPEEVLLYRKESAVIVLERIHPRSPAQVQLWRISIKGGEPWTLVVTLSEVSALRQELGQRQMLLDPEMANVREILNEFPMSSHLLTFTWHYRHRHKRYGRQDAPAQVIQVLLMEPVDLLNGLYFAHPTERTQFLTRLMLIYLSVTLRIEPTPKRSVKQTLAQLHWLQRLQNVAQKLIYAGHNIQPATMKQRWKRIGYQRPGGNQPKR